MLAALFFSHATIYYFCLQPRLPCTTLCFSQVDHAILVTIVLPVSTGIETKQCIQCHVKYFRPRKRIVQTIDEVIAPMRKLSCATLLFIHTDNLPNSVSVTTTVYHLGVSATTTIATWCFSHVEHVVLITIELHMPMGMQKKQCIHSHLKYSPANN